MLLTTAILAPSVITLTSIDEKGITVDLNEEEKKEEKKETKTNDFFIDSNTNALAQIQKGTTSMSSFYIEIDYATSLPIFLLPPKHTL